MEQASPSPALEQARARVKDMAKGFRAATVAWYMCSEEGRKMVTAHRDHLLEEKKREEAKHLLVEEIERPMQMVAQAAQFGDYIYETGSKRRAVEIEVVQDKLGEMRARMQEVEKAISKVQRARAHFYPTPLLAHPPPRDDSDFFKSYITAKGRLIDALRILSELQPSTGVSFALQKETDAAIAEVLCVE